ncbi:MAG TPA: glycosyltransferase N-terminal domain-containing protein, partial [Thermodesulfobacteriota bacterium]|nr:glycosyltransferase N-terminal domain-containing protein [Thermodesulfobacteriota bacterium]
MSGGPGLADRAALLLYQAGLAGAALAMAPLFLARMAATGRYRAGLAERLGRYPAGLAAVGAGRPVWLHAVSVGETVACLPLLTALAAAWPGLPLVVSTVTATGQAAARQRAREAAWVCYFPFDLAGPVSRAFDAIRPRLVLLAETELWPVFLAEAA